MNVDRLVRALLRANAHEGRAIVDEALREGVSPVRALDELLSPAMHEVGLRWEAGRIGVAHEHLASAAAGQLVAGLSPLLVTAEPGSRARVLLACAQGERHDLGLRMAQSVMQGAGYAVYFAGPDMPAAALVEAADRLEPALVGISSIGAWDPAAARESVRRLLARDPTVGVLLGGPGWAGYAPPEPSRVVQVGALGDLLAAAERLTAEPVA